MSYRNTHTCMLPFKLKYYRQTRNSGPTETLILCFRASEAGSAPRRKARGQPQDIRVLSTEPAEKHLPDLPRGHSHGHSEMATQSQAAGPRKSPWPLLPASFAYVTRPSLAPSGTSPNNKTATALGPIPDVFLVLSPSRLTPATTTISPQSRNSWRLGPLLRFHLPSFRKPGASTYSLLALYQAQSDPPRPCEYCLSPREVRQ